MTNVIYTLGAPGVVDLIWKQIATFKLLGTNLIDTY